MPHPIDDGMQDDPLGEYAGPIPSSPHGTTDYGEEPRTTPYPGCCSLCGEPTTTRGARHCVQCRNTKVARRAREIVFRARGRRLVREWFIETEEEIT
jgi:hypothetical protein